MKVHLRQRRADGTYGVRCQRDLGIAQHLQASLTSSMSLTKVTCTPCRHLNLQDVAQARGEVSA